MSLSNRFKKIFFPTEEMKVSKKDNVKPSKVILSPTSYNQAPEIAKTLLDVCQITVDMSNINENEKERLIDFLAGVIFPYKGKILTANDNKSFIFMIEKEVRS